MAFSVVAHTFKVGASGSHTTPNIDTTGADLIVIGIANNGTTNTAITDSKGNTYTSLTRYGSSGNPGIALLYCDQSASLVVGSGHNFTAAGNFAPIFVLAVSGSATSAFDAQNGAQGTGVSTLATGSVTPAGDNELVVSLFGSGGNVNSFSVDSGFTISDSQIGVNGTSYGGALAYLIQTAGAAVNPTWSCVSPGTNSDAAIAAFKAAAGGGGGTFQPTWARNANVYLGGRIAA